MDLLLVIQTILPAAIAIYSRRYRARSKFSSISLLCSVFLIYLHLFLILNWSNIGFIPRFALILLFVYATHPHCKRWNDLPSFESFGRVNTPVVVLMVLSFCSLFSIISYIGSTKTDLTHINIESPFGEGTYHVVHGGSNSFTNYHVDVPAQSYAMDVVRVNSIGIRAKSIIPRKLEDFLIYQNDLRSPCDGELVGIENNVDDNPLGESDEAHPLGNYVVIYCQGSSIVLAHMLKNSSQLVNGQKIVRGQFIGKVGNSGNTSEPHLHIHAVQGRHFLDNEILTNGKGLPLSIDNKFLIRNNLIRSKGHK